MKKETLAYDSFRLVVNESLFRVLMEGSESHTVYYRGCDSRNGVMLHDNVIWLTDSIEYAKEYAKECESPAVYEVIVDESKLKPISLYAFPEWFDGYDNPNEEILEIMKENGANCWMMDYDSFNAGGVALIDTVPIVSYRMLSDEEYDAIGGEE